MFEYVVIFAAAMTYNEAGIMGDEAVRRMVLLEEAEQRLELQVRCQRLEIERLRREMKSTVLLTDMDTGGTNVLVGPYDV
ncbi:hypothetical protein U1Q18_030464 [Sarracenia purpurea var. burkii]